MVGRQMALCGSRQIVGLVVLLAVPLLPCHAKEPRLEPSVDAVRASVAKALRYLDKTLPRLPDVQGTPRTPFTLAAGGIVLLVARDVDALPTERRGRALPKLLKRLDAWTEATAKRLGDPDQLPPEHGQFSSNHVIQTTWPLAMVAWLASELEAREMHTTWARTQARRVVPLLIAAQERDGGYGHGPVRDPEAGQRKRDALRKRLPPGAVVAGGSYPRSLVSATNLVGTALALLHARMSKRVLRADLGPTLARIRTHLEESELGNGNQPYDTTQRGAGGTRTGVPRAAGAWAALHLLGTPASGSPVQERHARWIDQHAADLSEGHGSSVLGLFHGALAMRLRGEAPWRRFRGLFFQRLLAHQGEDGHYVCICEERVFGATNDSKKAGIRLSGMPGMGPAPYVTVLHTWILLMDSVPPGKSFPTPEIRPATPTTPR